ASVRAACHIRCCPIAAATLTSDLTPMLFPRPGAFSYARRGPDASRTTRGPHRGDGTVECDHDTTSREDGLHVDTGGVAGAERGRGGSRDAQDHRVLARGEGGGPRLHRRAGGAGHRG